MTHAYVDKWHCTECWGLWIRTLYDHTRPEERAFDEHVDNCPHCKLYDYKNCSVGLEYVDRKNRECQ
jgi:hypothetical protein